MAQSHIKHTAHLINLRDILVIFLGALNLCCRQFVCRICKPCCGSVPCLEPWGLWGLHPAYCGLWGVVTQVFCRYENMTVIHKASRQDIPLSRDISEGCSSRVRDSSLQLSLRNIWTGLSGMRCNCWGFHVHWTQWCLWMPPSPVRSVIP